MCSSTVANFATAGIYGAATGGSSGFIDGLKLIHLPHRQLKAIGLPQAHNVLKYAEPDKWMGQLATNDRRQRDALRAQQASVERAEEEDLARASRVSGTSLIDDQQDFNLLGTGGA